MLIKYEIEVDNKAIINNLDRIINQIFKLLPSREEGLDWQTPLQSLILELSGMNKLLSDQTILFSVLCKLESLYTLTDEEDFFVFRKVIFECLNQLNEVKKCLYQ